MKADDKTRIYEYVRNTVSNNTKDRLFIELDIPCSKTSDDYGWFMFDISLEIIDLGYDCIYINPAGASDSSHTVVHIFIFSSSEDKKEFQKTTLELHKELDKKVIKMFKGEDING